MINAGFYEEFIGILVLVDHVSGFNSTNLQIADDMPV
jgi:hypothetical protein